MKCDRVVLGVKNAFS